MCSFAHIGVEDELPRVFVAPGGAGASSIPSRPACAISAATAAQTPACLRGASMNRMRRLSRLVCNGGHGLVVGLPGRFHVAREQIAALAGFCVQHALQQLVHIRPCGEPLGQLFQPASCERICPTSLMPTNTMAASSAMGKLKAICRTFLQQTPGVFLEIHTLILDND